MANYRIVGSEIQAVICDLASGEEVIAETGHLLTLTRNLDLETSTGGGLLSGLKRALGGSSFFVNKIVAARGEGQVAFSSPSPGKVHELDVGGGWLCQPHVFLCGDPTLDISVALTQKLGAGFFGGTGFMLQSLQGRGKAFVHAGGAGIAYDLQPGQTLRVATGSLVAFQQSVTYDIEMVRGWKSVLFSGEGLWFAHLTGPGRVIVQSLSLPHLAHALVPYLPFGESGGGGGGGALAGVALGGLLGSLMNDDN